MSNASFNRGLTWDYFSAAITQSGGQCPAEFADISAALRFLRRVLGRTTLTELIGFMRIPSLAWRYFLGPDSGRSS